MVSGLLQDGGKTANSRTYPSEITKPLRGRTRMDKVSLELLRHIALDAHVLQRRPLQAALRRQPLERCLGQHHHTVPALAQLDGE